VIDETRIEPALRQGPPFRTRYVQRPLPLGSETGLRGSRLLAMVLVIIVLVVAFGGTALVGSGVVQLPKPAPPPGNDAPTPAAIAWAQVASMAIARSGHSATLLPDGTVLVTGGNSGPADDPTDTVERYDPVTGSWVSVASMTSPRTGHSATLLPDGTVLVVGGWNGSVVVTSAERFDPGTGAWTTVTPMSQPRGGHLETLLADGTVLVVGGGDESPIPGAPTGAGTTLASAERYDYRTDSWTPAGSMTEPRGWNMTATLLPDGTVLAAGGSVWRSGGWESLASAETYDPDSGAWTATADMRYRRGGGQSATLLPDGTVLVVGLGPPERYDPSARSWVEAASPRWRSGHTATLLPDGMVLVAGGALGGSDDSFTDWVEWYDPRSGAWTATGPLSVARKGHSATLLLDGTVLVVGGNVGVTDGEWIQASSAELAQWGEGE
jgi:hypothetical protein